MIKGTELDRELLARALAEYSGRSLEVVMEFMACKPEAELLALANYWKLKPIIERLEAES